MKKNRLIKRGREGGREGGVAPYQMPNFTFNLRAICLWRLFGAYISATYSVASVGSSS